MKLYGEIAKVEEQDDGTIKVYGYASSEAVDSDGEIIKADAMEAAITDYMKFPAVHEMHQPIAAGTGIEMKVESDGRTWFGAHVVDPVAVKKVVNKVYRGFSIGAKVTGRDDANKMLITGIKLKEVSLVDRPANPEATIELWKADLEPEDAVEELAKMLTDRTVDAVTLLKLARGEKPEAEMPKPETQPPNPETEAAKTETDTDIQKSMWDVRAFAENLISIGYLCQSVKDEQAWRGTDSPIPDALKGWIEQGAAIFKDMASEQADALVAACQKAKADQDIDVAKSGARFSKATKGALAGIHKMLRDCDKALSDMGYETAEEEDEGAGKVDAGLDKTAAEKNPQPVSEPPKDDVQKMVGDLGARLTQLVEKVSKLEAEPAAPKGKLLAVEKSDEVSIGQKADPLDGFQLVKKSDGSVDEAASMIKLVHRTGGVRLGSQ